MLPAGFAATAKEPYPAAGITLQHPDPHSDWRTARFGILTSTAIEPCHSLDMPVARGGPDGGLAYPVRDPRRASMLICMAGSSFM